MVQFFFRILISIKLAFVLNACDETPPRDPARASEEGWAISTAGDLNDFFDCLDDAGATMIAAHRGGAYPRYPENALETMQYVSSKAPAFLEIDVAASRDGVLFLMHDDRLERTTTGEGAVDSLSWAQIKGLTLVDNDGRRTPFHPPRLVDVMRWANGRTVLQLDIKKSVRYEDIARVIEAEGAQDRVVLIAYTLGQAQKLARLAPGVSISLSVKSRNDIERALRAGISADRILAFTGTQAPNAGLYRYLESKNIEIIFGTLGGTSSIDAQITRSGNEGRYADLSKAGVDLLSTDRPIEAHAALIGQKRAPSPACGVEKLN